MAHVPEKCVVFIVGHEDWGKSQTLKEVTAGNCHGHTLEIGDATFYIRHMSNDDRPNSFVRFVTRLKDSGKTHVIAPLCPNFHRPSARTSFILSTLRDQGFGLSFWVMLHQFPAPHETITVGQIEELRTYGHVEVYEGHDEANERARLFTSFITGMSACKPATPALT